MKAILLISIILMVTCGCRNQATIRATLHKQYPKARRITRLDTHSGHKDLYLMIKQDHTIWILDISRDQPNNALIESAQQITGSYGISEVEYEKIKHLIDEPKPKESTTSTVYPKKL